MDAVFIKQHHKKSIPHKNIIGEGLIDIIGCSRIHSSGYALNMRFVHVPAGIVQLYPFRVLCQIDLRQIPHINLIPASHCLLAPHRFGPEWDGCQCGVGFFIHNRYLLIVRNIIRNRNN